MEKRRRSDQPLSWHQTEPTKLWVDCPICDHPARVVKAAGSRRNQLINLEAICGNCEKYRYLLVEVLNGKTLHVARSPGDSRLPDDSGSQSLEVR